MVRIVGWLGLACVALLCVTARAQDMRLADVLIEGQGWELVGEGLAFSEGPAVDAKGNLYFSDVMRSKLYRLGPQGKPEVFVDQSYGCNGLKFGADGRLYGCQGGKKRIVAYDMDGKDETIVDDVKSNDLVMHRSGGFYFTDPENHQVWYVSPSREKKVVDRGMGYPNGLALTPDQGTLVVVDMKSDHVYAFRVEPNGDLKFKQAFFPLRVPEGKTDIGADGMMIDSAGRVFVATQLGLQMFDPSGRLCGVIDRPQNAWLSNVVLAGPDLDTLYVTSTAKVYRRKVNTKGFRPFAVDSAKK